MWERYRKELHELEMGNDRREELVALLAAELEGNEGGVPIVLSTNFVGKDHCFRAC